MKFEELFGGRGMGMNITAQVLQTAYHIIAKEMLFKTKEEKKHSIVHDIGSSTVQSRIEYRVDYVTEDTCGGSRSSGRHSSGIWDPPFAILAS